RRAGPSTGSEDGAAIPACLLPQKRQKGSRGEALRGEPVGEARDGEIRCPILLLVDEGVVEAVDIEISQLLVVRVGTPVVVTTAPHLIEVLRDAGPGRADPVDPFLLHR